MQDTTPEAAAHQAEIYRQMGSEKRFELAWEMSLMAREFSLSRIRDEHPDFNEFDVMKTYVNEVLLPGVPVYKNECPRLPETNSGGARLRCNSSYDNRILREFVPWNSNSISLILTAGGRQISSF